jgi:hypothetical protein
MELYRTLGVLDDILREHIPVPEIRNCELGSGFSQVISVLNTSPYMVPTPECPYVSSSPSWEPELLLRTDSIL